MRAYALGMMALTLLAGGCATVPGTNQVHSPSQQVQAQQPLIALGADAFQATDMSFVRNERQPYIDLFTQQQIELNVSHYSAATAASSEQVRASAAIQGKWYAYGFFELYAGLSPTMIEVDTSTPGVLRLEAAGLSDAEGDYRFRCPISFRLTSISSDDTFAYSLTSPPSSDFKCWPDRHKYYDAIIVRPVGTGLVYIEQRLVGINVPQVRFAAKRERFW